MSLLFGTLGGVVGLAVMAAMWVGTVLPLAMVVWIFDQKSAGKLLVAPVPLFRRLGVYTGRQFGNLFRLVGRGIAAAHRRLFARWPFWTVIGEVVLTLLLLLILWAIGSQQ